MLKKIKPFDVILKVENEIAMDAKQRDVISKLEWLLKDAHVDEDRIIRDGKLYNNSIALVYVSLNEETFQTIYDMLEQYHGRTKSTPKIQLPIRYNSSFGIISDYLYVTQPHVLAVKIGNPQNLRYLKN